MFKHIKQTDRNADGEHLRTTILIFDESEDVIASCEVVDEEPEEVDMPFSRPDRFQIYKDYWMKISFDDAKFIDNKYVVKQESEFYNGFDSYRTYRNTFFNSKKQIIRVEELSGYSNNYIMTIKYDDDGNIIEETIAGSSENHQFKSKINFYESTYNDKKNEFEKKLKYSKYNDGAKEEHYKYSLNGDLISLHVIERWGDEITEYDYFYFYDDNGNDVGFKYFKNKELISIIDREQGDFTKLLPDNYEDLLYSNNEYSDIILLKGDDESNDFPF